MRFLTLLIVLQCVIPLSEFLKYLGHITQDQNAYGIVMFCLGLGLGAIVMFEAHRREEI